MKIGIAGTAAVIPLLTECICESEKKARAAGMVYIC